MPSQLVLTRWWTDQSDAVVGRLISVDGSTYFTLEEPWRWNQPTRSHIPAGFYKIERDTFHSQYENFKIPNVVGRSAIEMHIGNSSRDTEGCILIGNSIQFTRDQTFLLDSRNGFRRFMRSMKGIDHAILAIVNALDRMPGMPA